MPPVRQRREHIGGRQHLEAMALEVEVRDHLQVQQAHQVGEHREGEARHDLLRDRGAADHVAPLQHQRVEPRLCEISTAGEPVVPAADHDRVVFFRHSIPQRRPASPPARGYMSESRGQAQRVVELEFRRMW